MLYSDTSLVTEGQQGSRSAAVKYGSSSKVIKFHVSFDTGPETYFAKQSKINH